MACVGIDLGTTTSAVAMYDESSGPRILRDTIVDSYFGFDNKSKNPVVGSQAKVIGLSSPEHVVSEVKRNMGSGDTLRVGDQDLTPPEISAHILTHLKQSAEEQLDEEVDRCVITVPANFPDPARRATQQAGEIAGMTVERIINEPTAAALAYGYGNDIEDEHILVYDLSDVTFDVSVVERMGDILGVKASTGDRQLGGKDFDRALLQYVADQFEAEHSITIDEDTGNYYRLLFACEDAKKDLNFNRQVNINIPFFTVKDDQPISLDVTVTRDTFEELIGPMIDRTEAAIETALADADLTPPDIDQVILVGGSTRIPYVQKLVEHVMGQPPLKRIDPNRVVALGAAVQTAIIEGTSDRIAMDMVPFSAGIAAQERSRTGVQPGRYIEIIPRDAKVRTPHKMTFNTKSLKPYKKHRTDDRKVINFPVYQRDAESDAMQAEIDGEPNEAEGFTLLERLEIKVPPGPTGQTVELVFAYNQNQMLEVEVYFPRTDETENFRVHAGLDEGEIATSQAKVQGSWRESDFIEDVEALIAAAEQELTGSTVPNSQEGELRGLLNDLKQALAENDESRIRTLDDEITVFLFALGDSDRETSRAKARETWRESDFFGEVEGLISAAKRELQKGTVPDAEEGELRSLLTELKQALAANDESRIHALDRKMTDLIFKFL